MIHYFKRIVVTEQCLKMLHLFYSLSVFILQWAICIKTIFRDLYEQLKCLKYVRIRSVYLIVPSEYVKLFIQLS